MVSTGPGLDRRALLSTVQCVPCHAMPCLLLLLLLKARQARALKCHTGPPFVDVCIDPPPTGSKPALLRQHEAESETLRERAARKKKHASPSIADRANISRCASTSAQQPATVRRLA